MCARRTRSGDLQRLSTGTDELALIAQRKTRFAKMRVTFCCAIRRTGASCIVLVCMCLCKLIRQALRSDLKKVVFDWVYIAAGTLTTNGPAVWSAQSS